MDSVDGFRCDAEAQERLGFWTDLELLPGGVGEFAVAIPLTAGQEPSAVIVGGDTFYDIDG